FRGWTADNLVRQAAFKGVREDKPTREVTREVPVEAGAHIPPPKGEGGRAKRDRVGGKSNDRARGRNPHPTASAALLQSTSPLRGEVSAVRFTHPERVYWEDAGVTKQNLADYYRAVWRFMAPHVVNRPLALVRCPDGTKGECFFQKHASAGLTEEHLK